MNNLLLWDIKHANLWRPMLEHKNSKLKTGLLACLSKNFICAVSWSTYTASIKLQHTTSAQAEANPSSIFLSNVSNSTVFRLPKQTYSWLSSWKLVSLCQQSIWLTYLHIKPSHLTHFKLFHLKLDASWQLSRTLCSYILGSNCALEHFLNFCE